MRVTLQRETIKERPAWERDVHILGKLLRGTAMKDKFTPWKEVAGLVPDTCLSIKMEPLYIIFQHRATLKGRYQFGPRHHSEDKKHALPLQWQAN